MRGDTWDASGASKALGYAPWIEAGGGARTVVTASARQKTKINIDDNPE
jgi:hypothetical protein